MQKVKVNISKIKKVLTRGGVDGIAENIILPAAILPVKNIKSCKDFFIYFSEKIPIKHKIPTPRFKPPYIPASSE